MLEQRPLSSKEIKLLNTDLKYILKNRSGQLRFLIGWVLLCIIIGTFFYFKLNSTQEHYLLFGCAFIYILIGVWVFLEQSIRLIKKQKSINFALSKGTTKYIRVTTSRYIEFSEYEDEGVDYLFQLNDNEMLSIGGQDFYPTKKFPNTDFEIVVCYGIKNEILLLETYNYGEKLRPTIKVNGKEKWALMESPNYPHAENFKIIPGNIEDYYRILKS